MCWWWEVVKSAHFGGFGRWVFGVGEWSVAGEDLCRKSWSESWGMVFYEKGKRERKKRESGEREAWILGRVHVVEGTWLAKFADQIHDHGVWILEREREREREREKEWELALAGQASVNLWQPSDFNDHHCMRFFLNLAIFRKKTPNLG